jgi:hypothetical protein
MTHAASFADQLVIFGDDSDGSVDLGGFALDGQVIVILQCSGDVQRGFQQLDVFVQRAKEGLCPACNLYDASHVGFGRPVLGVLPTDAG